MIGFFFLGVWRGGWGGVRELLWDTSESSSRIVWYIFSSLLPPPFFLYVNDLPRHPTNCNLFYDSCLIIFFYYYFSRQSVNKNISNLSLTRSFTTLFFFTLFSKKISPTLTFWLKKNNVIKWYIFWINTT